MVGKLKWEWWVVDDKGHCLVQNINLVLSVFSGVLITIFIYGILMMKKTSENKNVKATQLYNLINKHKYMFVLYIVLSFVVTFVISNLILTKYCGVRPDGGLNILYSLLLFFVAVPIIQSVVHSVLSKILLGDVENEVQMIEYL